MNEQEQSGTVGTGLTAGNILGWAKMLLLEPKRFFSSMAKSGGFGTPVGYALAWLFASAVTELIIGRIRPQPVKFGWGIEIGWLIAGPFILVGFGFVVSAIFFVIWHLMGSKENYETAFRVWAFTTPVAVLGALLGVAPFLNILAFLYGLFLLVVASIETHRLSPRKSWTVWGVVALLLGALIGFSFLARTAMQQQGADLGGAQVPGVPGATPNDQAAFREMAEKIQKEMEAQMKKQDGAAPAPAKE